MEEISLTDVRVDRAKRVPNTQDNDALRREIATLRGEIMFCKEQRRHLAGMIKESEAMIETHKKHMAANTKHQEAEKRVKKIGREQGWLYVPESQIAAQRPLHEES